MQKLILILSLFFTATILYAEKVPSIIKSVTVYYSEGAKISRTASTTVPKGNSEIILDNLPSGLSISSVQVALDKKGIRIMDISYNRDYLTQRQKPEVIQALSDSLAIVIAESKWIRKEIELLKGEEKILNANDRTYSNNNGVSTEELEKLLRFYRKHSKEIRREIEQLEYRSAGLTQQENKIRNQYRQANSQSDPIGQIVVEVLADRAVQTNIDFSYFVQRAGWIPSYEVKSMGPDQPLQLTYKAAVYQSTDYDWDKVELFLSSVKPNRDNTHPNLDVVFARMDSPDDYSVDTVMTFDPETYEEQITVIRNDLYVEVERLETSVLWKINGPQNIPTDGRSHMLTIKEENIPASYEYYAAPVKETYAYLIANIANYGQYDLLPGEMSIFFEDTYVGKSDITADITSDTLMISMGQDAGITVERKKRDFTAPKFIGLTKKETRSYEIIVRNNKRKAIDIRIVDQLPISTHKNIEVKLLSKSKANHNENNGFLTWNINVAPDKTKQLDFSYSLKYPKDRNIWEE